jgi:copper chaperone CopZ
LTPEAETEYGMRIRVTVLEAELMASEPLVYIDLGVGGMTCDDCVRHVTAALESVPGVHRAEVSLAGRGATVEASPDTATEALTAAVRASGYNAFLRRRRPT